MKKLYNSLIFLFILMTVNTNAQSAFVDLEGITNPPLAIYLASYEARYIFPLKSLPNSINFKKMTMYRKPYFPEDKRYFDTIEQLNILFTFEFNSKINLLLKTFFHVSQIPGNTKEFQYFNENGQVIKRLTLETKASLTDTTLNETFQYDNNGNIIDTLNYKYDTLGRLVQFKEHKWSQWTRLLYNTPQNILPDIIISPYDSTLLYYENDKLIKKMTLATYDEKLYVGTKIRVEQYFYSKDGKKTEEIIYESDYRGNSIRKKFTYNEIGQLISIENYFFYTDILISKIIFEYDKNNLIKKEKINLANNFDRTYKTLFYYDEKNNLIKIENQVKTLPRYYYDNWIHNVTSETYYYSYEY